MTDPVVEQLAQALETRLKNVTTDAGANYTAKILRPRRTYSAEHMLISIEQGPPVIDPELSVEGNPHRVAWVQPFHITVFVKPPDEDVEPIDAMLNRLCADAMKAVCTSGSSADWAQWGGLAVTSNWGEPVDQSPGDGAYYATTLPLNITYRVSHIDPFTAA